MANVLGGSSRVIRPNIRSTLLRYTYSAILTFRYIRNLPRDSIVIVVAPPVFLPALVMAFGLGKGISVIMDSHPGAFGLMNDWFSAVLKPLHVWCMRRAEMVLVTNENLAAKAQSAGGNALVFHEPYVYDEVEDEVDSNGSSAYTVVFAGNFSRDEPVDVIDEAAQFLPEVKFLITGEQKTEREKPWPPNVSVTGWLEHKTYKRVICGADLVVVLTTDDDSVMRAAIEAIRWKKALVVSETRSTTSYFPFAWHIDNAGVALADVVQEVMNKDELDLQNRIQSAFRAEREVAFQQVAELRNAIERIRSLRGR